MKKVTIGDVAKKVKVSESTVKRVLYNMPGVSFDIKKKVLDAAKKLGYDFPEKKADIGVVLPLEPAVFWKRIRNCCEMFGEISEYSLKIFSYKTINQEEEILFCLNQAIQSGISVLIIAGCNTKSVKNQIEKVSEKIFVILLEEYLGIENCCFVGENSFKSGYEITKKYFSLYPDREQMILLRANSFSAVNRVLGIQSALRDLKKPDAIIIDVEGLATITSLIARKLDQYKDKIDCVCHVCNFAYLSCIAINKLKTDKDIHCIGFESHPMNKKYLSDKTLKLLCYQELRRQTELALELAVNFLKTGKRPDEKNIYVDNSFIPDLD